MLEKALYIVATPIGNLDDISKRAIDVLSNVDLIAAEDTRHSKKLLTHFNISTSLIPYHEHNEDKQSGKLLDILKTNKSIALISDAGTPLISDPGYTLVSLAWQNNIKVIPIPGPCAFIAALSASGLPTDRFMFAGFLPAKQAAKEKELNNLLSQNMTIVFYESCHRILSTLEAIKMFLENTDRQVVIAREISKRYETIIKGTINEIFEIIANNEMQQKGEMVLIIQGEKKKQELTSEAKLIIETLCSELPLKQAVSIAAKITNLKKNFIYQYALELNS